MASFLIGGCFSAAIAERMTVVRGNGGTTQRNAEEHFVRRSFGARPVVRRSKKLALPLIRCYS